jgi:spermidine/putrescine transport system substrate-binding protein
VGDRGPLSGASHSRMTRRRFLEAGAVAGAAAVASPLLAACSSSSTPEPGATGGSGTPNLKGQTLNLFTWSSYHDKDWINGYEQSRGVTVNVQYTGSVPDMFAKTKADPSAYDLVLATSGFIENYVGADLIIPIEESRIPNIANMTSAFHWRDASVVNGKNYAVCYTWGDQPLCWVPSKVSPAPDSWGILWDTQYAGRVSMVDDPVTVLPLIPLYLGFPDPFNMTPSQFAEFRTWLFKLRGQMTHVAASINDQTQDFANGDVWLGDLYDESTWAKLRDDGFKLEFELPKEGSPAWSDNYCITKAAGANKQDLCYDFINYTLSVPWQARFIERSGHQGILSYEEANSPEARKAGLTKAGVSVTLLPETLKGAEFFDKLHLLRAMPNLEEFLNTWNEFKVGLN